MARDNTKYKFEESVYGKGRLVHAVVATYIERYDATLAQLEQIFPGSLQNKNGNVFITQQEYDERLSKSSDVENRFYNKAEDRLLTHDGITIYVSNQWGVGNVEGFYQQAIKQGFTIEKIISPSQATLEPFFTASNENTMSPLNQILYGPPGTGKTYHTMESAVKAAEPTFTWTNRDELKAEYVRLVGDKRIRFVTFHQSYGYEEFVEGLSAKTEGNQIAYYEKDGIFKTISEDADKYRVTKTVESDRDFDSLWAKFLTELSQNENGIRVNTIRTFFIVTDVDNNTIRFEKDKGDSTHSLSVKTLKAVFNDEREIKGGLNPYYSSLIKHLSAYSNQTDTVHIDRKNFVLVIDEINRGNISKIFGELITLIEPSKRKGAEEEIELVLPYSGDTFSVPDNLHIIGTMNTADRSLAMMDTALRRRFDFIEMMPKPELFNNKQIKGIDLTRLLNALNKRIEALYDREHTLGHAFLFPAYNEQDEDKAFELLKAAFKNKIIPLLEEYFYDDWNKIRLVLGDNQKSDELRFVKVHNEYYDSLFGSEHGLETYEESKTRYTLMSFNGENSVWDNPQAYIAVYASIK
ncbi:AAA domain-containing protein [Aliivibrio fischeri]|uniref:McrB family protein n=1 Tax=Aliivibrio fischeri TaxID=668 RepID=UPI0012D8DDAE|nr:AAA family ATPase [Aliivibrio fischeri]MUK61559.1 AAA domain-containing protein [Aliivibrio fischeri]MUL22170.1 AAA domain-containing protein [Aliivibrio fischeri]MUL25615.1 AAA domain-containing protein [Aliivibrio fischeri]